MTGVQTCALPISSYQVKIDDVVALTPQMEKNLQVTALLQEEDKVLVPFLKKEGFSGKLLRMPKKDDVQVPFDLQLIIEYYSR